MNETLTKCGYVAVVGRPNAGKSSLLNWIIGENLTLVSHKANATRKRANIIEMYEDSQIIFVDTPGLHEKERLLNKFMLDEALKAIGDCDLILFLAPATDDIKHYEHFLQLAKGKPHIILLNKIDTVDKERLFKKIQEYEKYQNDFLALIPFSIKKASNKEILLKEISKHLPEHPYLYDTEILTTQNLRDIYKELIRETLFENLSDEIPYFSDVIIEQVDDEDEDLESIYACIIVDKKSQKGMVVGKNGATVKRIGQKARAKIERLIDKKVFLKLYVKQVAGWTKDKDMLSKIGYEF